MRRTHCKMCGEKLVKEKRMYCSLDCWREYERHKRISKLDVGDWKTETRVCEYCGDEYQPKHWRAKYCTNTCANAARKAKTAE